MAFLRLNGWEIPVMESNRTDEEIGFRRRSYGGDLQTDRRALKRSWRIRTKHMSRTDAEALKGVVMGLGHQLKFDGESLYTDKGLAPDLTTGVTFPKLVADDGDPVLWYDGTNTFTPGGYGSNAIFAHGQATANLFSQNVRNGTDDGTTTGFTPVVVTSSTLNSATTDQYQGPRSLRVIAGGSGDGVYAATAVSSNTVYYFSVFVKGDAGEIVNLTMYDQATTTFGSNFQVTLINDTWIRIAGSMTSSGSATNMLGYLWSSSGAQTFYADAWQMEAEPSGPPSPFFGTDWVDGTLSGASLPSWPLSMLNGRENSTVHHWSNLDTFGALSGTVWKIYNDGAITSDYYRLTKRSTGNIYIIQEKDGAQSSTGEIAASSGLNSYTVSVRQNPGSDEEYYTVYENGAQIIESAGNFDIPVFDDAQLLIGARTLTANALFSPVDEFLIVPYAAPESLSLAWYNMGVAIPNLPGFYVDGDMIPDPEYNLVCQGRVTNVDYVRVKIGDTWHNNAQVVEFEIQEV